jgi:hypothetical protein
MTHSPEDVVASVAKKTNDVARARRWQSFGMGVPTAAGAQPA